MKKLKSLCRLLSTVLAISLIISGTNLTVFASEIVDIEEASEEIATFESESTVEDVIVDTDEYSNEIADIPLQSTVDTTENTIVHISEGGNISYEIIPVIPEETLTYSNEDIVILNDTSSALQDDGIMATASSTKLEDVSPFVVSFAPYKHMCLITATFPNGTVMDSSGILISKNLVLASAHGIYNHERGGAAKHVEIGIGTYFTDSERVAQGGIQSWNGAYLNIGWTEKQLARSDWSLIILSQNVPTYEKCGYVPDIENAKGKDIRVIGYSGIPNIGSVYFKYGTGEITGTTNNIATKEELKNIWKYSIESEEGMSGGPIIEQSSGLVIGVVKGTVSNILGIQISTVGVPLTKEIADVILEKAIW